MKIAAVVLVALLLMGCGGDVDPSQSHPDAPDAPIIANATVDTTLADTTALLAIAKADLQAQITINAGYDALLRGAESRENIAIAEAASLRNQLRGYEKTKLDVITYRGMYEEYKTLADNLTGEIYKLAVTDNQTATLIRVLSDNVTYFATSNAALELHNEDLTVLLKLAYDRIDYLVALTANTTGGE